MILSHELRVIFLKTTKVGGTSFEIALSKYCGPNDIITPISIGDERTRKKCGFCPPQNHIESNRTGYAVDGHPNETIHGDFKNHIMARGVSKRIGSQMFSAYTKIAIHRDPLDFLISMYYWKVRRENNEIPFKTWLNDSIDTVLINYRIAPVHGPFACDKIIRYEQLDKDISEIRELPSDFLQTFKSLNAKGSVREKVSRKVEAFFVENQVEDQIPEIYEMVDRFNSAQEAK